MNICQTEVVKMLHQLPVFFNKNRELLEDNTILSIHVNKLDRNLAMLKAYIKYQNTDIKTIYSKKEVSAEAQQMIEKTAELLRDSIDKDMELYKTIDKELYQSYKEARKIDKKQQTDLSLKGHIVDGYNHKQELKFVIVSVKFRPGSGLKDRVTVSDKNGYYQFKSLPIAECSIVFEKGFYVTHIIDTKIKPNRTTVLDMKMKNTLRLQKN